MTIRQITDAFMAARKLCAQDTLSRAYGKKAYQLRRLLQPVVDYRVEEETKIFERHPRVDRQTMTITFTDDAQKDEALDELRKTRAELDELAGTEWDRIEFERFTIPAGETVRISGDEMGALEPFIEFE